VTLGKLARQIFGRNFHALGKLYRSIFVDLEALAKSISSYIPPNATVVDVGGGDGEPLNELLHLRKDIKVKLIDLSPGIGNAIRNEYSGRVEVYPETSTTEFFNKTRIVPDVILINDVVHHVANEARKAFFSDLRAMAGDKWTSTVIIKDVEPGFFRSALGLAADRYVSGDKQTSLIGREDLSRMFQEAFGAKATIEEAGLFKVDKPNYALVFKPCRSD